MSGAATPHPPLRGTFSRKGRRGIRGWWGQNGATERSSPQCWSPPSPLAGEGVAKRRMRGHDTFDSRGQFMPQDRLPPTTFARKLRREMTEAERRLWSALRGRRFSEFKFRRQVPIGPYIADFLCFSHKVIVEVDGGQHSESVADEKRDAWLKAQGFFVLRFWNGEVLRDRTSVFDTLYAELALRSLSSGPSGHLLPQGEKGR